MNSLIFDSVLDKTNDSELIGEKSCHKKKIKKIKVKPESEKPDLLRRRLQFQSELCCSVTAASHEKFT